MTEMMGKMRLWQRIKPPNLFSFSGSGELYEMSCGIEIQTSDPVFPEIISI
jgi:hypothetical protein